MSAFELGRGNNKNTERILIAALAVVIAGTIFCTLYFGGGQQAHGEFHMYCLGCGKSLTLNHKQMLMQPLPPPATNAPPGAAPATGGTRFVCPECKTGTLIFMRACQKCGHLFVTDWDKTHPAGVQNPGDVPPPISCPKCNAPQSVPPMPGGAPADTNAPTTN